MAATGKTDTVVKNITGAAEIEGKHTDFLITDYSDKLFIVVSHYGKFGTMIHVTKDKAIDGPEESATYTTKALFGKDDTILHVISRGLAEKLDVSKPILFSLALKDPSPRTMQAIYEQLVLLMKR